MLGVHAVLRGGARAALLVLVLLVGAGPAWGAGVDDGPWGWPLAGPHEVARPFQPPATAYAAGHRGADLPGIAGAPVRAAAAGRVSYAGLLAGRGVVVVVQGMTPSRHPWCGAMPSYAGTCAGRPVPEG